MATTLYKNAHIINPYSPIIQNKLVVSDGIIVSDTTSLPEDTQIIDLDGAVICPSFTDLHTHLREPGQTSKETVETASAAAKAGGYGTLIAMPNTIPAIDNPEIFRSFSEECKRRSSLHIIQSVAITIGRNGTEVTDIPALKEAGVQVLTDDGSTPQDIEVMRKAARLAASCNLPLIDHCENFQYSRPGVMHRGTVSQELGIPGQPNKGETTIVARDIALSRETGVHFHLQHLSCAASIQMIAEAQKEGLKITGEITPHHLSLTHEAIRAFGTNAKMAPPLREESDRQALIQALKDGIITCVATDHAPHTTEEKSQGMLKAPFGIIGLEYAFQICHKILCVESGISLERLVYLFTKGPRNILNLSSQPFFPGTPASFNIIHLNKEYTIDVSKGHSKSTNCPYDGMKVFCKITPVE